MVNPMLCSWILNIINPKLRMTIAYCETASGMSKDLKKRYSVANTPKIHQLKADIANCKQWKLKVGEFYSKLTNLWNELGNHIKIPTCTCSGCKYGVGEKNYCHV